MSIRKITIEDGSAMLDFFKRLVKEDPERVERPVDIAKLTVADELTWIDQRVDREKSRKLFDRIDVKEKEIVAEGEIERMKRWIEKHVAELRFGVLPGHEEVAQELVQELIGIAKVNDIEVLLYFHLATQKAGISVVKKAGFYEVGRIKNYYKNKDLYIDRIYMALTL